MPKVELSDCFIATLKPQTTGALDYFDTKAKGLNLRVWRRPELRRGR